MTAGSSRGGGERGRAGPLSAARLAAVQALYQMDMAGTEVNDVLAQFAAHPLGRETDAGELMDADAAFFRDILSGVVREQRDIDPRLDRHLAEGWRLMRIDSILRAILRSAAFEILYRPDTPAKVVINEYVDVAHAFFEGEEPKAVNGILDKLARSARPAELGAPPHAS